MPLAPTNQQLASSWMLPGIYMQLNLTGASQALGSDLKKLLLIATKSASGTAGADTPVQVLQQSDANTFFGQGSDAARLYAASSSQIPGGSVDVYVCPIAEPTGGTAATHLFAFAGTATSAGSVDLTVCGYFTSVGVANGDTASVVATNVSAALNLLTDLPATFSPSSGTVTATYRHKGLGGNDFPRIVTLTNVTGITCSPGTDTITGPATGSGTVTLTVGTSTVTATVNNSDSATTIATNLAAAINAGAFPVTATSAAAVVTLFYASGRVVHRITSSANATGVTATVAVGTSGAGTPTLTNALVNLSALRAFKGWATSYNDTTSLGTLSAHIETMGDGLNQKGQKLTACSTESLSTAGAIPTGTSPALTASPRYALGWCPDSPQQAYELAGRMASRRVFEDYAPRNYDGEPLQTRGTVPLLLPHRAVRPSPASQNSALYSFYLTPLIVDETQNKLVIVRGRTTSNAADPRLWDWGIIDAIDFYRYDLNVYLVSLFFAQGNQKNLRASGTPKTVNTVSPTSVKDAIYVRMKRYDDNDLFDDIDSVKGAILVNVDAVVPTRLDIGIPMRPPPPLHQLGIVGTLT